MMKNRPQSILQPMVSISAYGIVLREILFSLLIIDRVTISNNRRSITLLVFQVISPLRIIIIPLLHLSLTSVTQHGGIIAIASHLQKVLVQVSF
jgi:hypothetical protein